MGSIRVAIIDDHPLFRTGVVQGVLETGRFEIAAEGTTLDDTLRIVEVQNPDILLLDVAIPGGGLEALHAIVERCPGQKIVMLTVLEFGGNVIRAMRAGAKGSLRCRMPTASRLELKIGSGAKCLGACCLNA